LGDGCERICEWWGALGARSDLAARVDVGRVWVMRGERICERMSWAGGPGVGACLDVRAGSSLAAFLLPAFGVRH
jgi:hypothetical protein